MTFAFTTLGCKVNAYDTRAMTEFLERSGFTAATGGDDPDFLIVNTCCVTAESARKSRQMARRLKAEHPASSVVLVGCYPKAFPDEAAAVADGIAPGAAPVDLQALLESLASGQVPTKKKELGGPPPREANGVLDTPGVSAFPGHTRATLKIEDGCDGACAYCIIPKCRGPVRSKPPGDVRAEAEMLADAGYKEIVAVGINLSAYGKGERFTLADAADAIAGVPGVARVRLGSLEFDRLGNETLSRLAANPKLCPHFHLSLQSGSDRVLSAMRRPYTGGEYVAFAEKLRRYFPGAALTTDVIVGFPGERETDFLCTARLVERVGFARTHIFPFSPRPGTVAAGLPEQVPNETKKARCRRLREICDATEDRFLAGEVGQTANVLFETAKNGICEGYSERYTRVRVKTGRDLRGEILPVRLTEAQRGCCFGETV